MDENNVVIKYLEKKGYNINTDYYKKIEYWKSWYQNHNKDFHEYRDQYGDTKEVYKNVKFLKDNAFDIPESVMFTYNANNKKNIKLDYLQDIRDTIKDIYKHI